MWNTKKFCWFQFLTFLILPWMILGSTKALQDAKTENVAVVDVDNINNHLSEQLFEFAQIFSTVNSGFKMNQSV